MKILFNGYKNLFDNQGKQPAAGGPRLFTQQFVDYITKQNHYFVGLVVISKKNLGKKVKLENKIVKNGKWVEARIKLNLNLILNKSKKSLDYYSEHGLKEIIKIYKQENPDVILLNGYSLTNWYMLKAANLAKIPVVLAHHGLWFKEDREVIANANAHTFKVVRQMEKDIFNYSDKQIFLNDFTRKIFEKEYKVSTKSKSIIIPLPYNPEFLNKTLPKRNKDKIKKIGFVGRWDAIKNPEIIYNIATEAKRQMKDWKIYSVIKIKKEVKLLKYLEEKFVKNVKVLEPMLPKKLKKFYQQMDLLILPSRFETFAAVALEAALQNRGTIIAPEVGFREEYEKYKLKDWIYDFKNPANTVQYIEKMLEKKLPKKFIKYLKQNNNPKRTLKQYLDILKETANKKNYEGSTISKQL